VIICHKDTVNLCIANEDVQDHLTHGCSISGCQSGSLTGIQTTDNKLKEGGLAISLSVSPNPLSTRTKVEFLLAKGGRYKLEIFDMKGSFLSILATGEAAQGQTLFYELNAGKYANVMYFIRLVTGTEVMTKRIVIQQ
jgi:hypothetical protein